MSLKDTHAFPVSPDTLTTSAGMTLHQYYVGQAIIGILSNERLVQGRANHEWLSSWSEDMNKEAIRIADGIIEQLEQ